MGAGERPIWRHVGTEALARADAAAAGDGTLPHGNHGGRVAAAATVWCAK